MDEDLQQLMLRCLEIEKQEVREQLEDYRTAFVVVLTPEGRYIEKVSFFGEEEKIAAYSAVVQKAKASDATVIITINAARTLKAESDDELEGYYWGKLADVGARDCISITASGPGMKSIALDLSYEILNGLVHFDEVEKFCSTEVGMLPDWPGDVPKMPS